MSAPVAESLQYLTFFIAGEEFAVGVLRVKEIIAYGGVTQVPTTPAWIRGVINLRGSVVPVVDLAAKFGLPVSPLTKRTCVVILEVDIDGERQVMGVVADAVSQVIELGPDAIEAPPAFGSRVRVDCIRGMGKAGAALVMVLDIERVLAAPALLALETAHAQAAASEAAAP